MSSTPLFSTSDLDDRQSFCHHQIVNLICAQIGMPSKERLEQLKNRLTFFKKDKENYTFKKAIPIAFTPWESMVEQACRERKISFSYTRKLIDLIGRCLVHERRITARRLFFIHRKQQIFSLAWKINNDDCFS